MATSNLLQIENMPELVRAHVNLSGGGSTHNKFLKALTSVRHLTLWITLPKVNISNYRNIKLKIVLSVYYLVYYLCSLHYETGCESFWYDLQPACPSNLVSICWTLLGSSYLYASRFSQTKIHETHWWCKWSLLIHFLSGLSFPIFVCWLLTKKKETDDSVVDC